MDVPSWHPANEDAKLTRQMLGSTTSATQRTEFKLMPGSTADTSTDAGRELLNELTRGADGGSAAVEGRGFFDSSDRLYLQEQKRLDREKLEQKRKHDQAVLHSFRSTALKVQSQKAVALASAAADVQQEPKKKTSTFTAIVIKTKKRRATTSSSSFVKDVCSKPTKQRKRNECTSKTTLSEKPAKTSGALLRGYSSSSDSGEEEAGSGPESKPSAQEGSICGQLN